MKILQESQKYLKTLGIEPTQSTHIYSFNGKLFVGFLVYASSIILNLLFLVYSFNSMMEFIQCICVVCALIVTGLCFFTIVLQKRQLFSLIESTEKMINGSKCILSSVLI